MRSLIILLLMSMAMVQPVQSQEQVEKYLSQLEKVGKGRLSFLFWDIYDAELFAPKGQWQKDKPFALKLSYLIDLDGDEIADQSVREIRQLGFSDELRLADWHSQMSAIFPDVSDGVSLIGVYVESGETLFFNGSEQIGRIKDKDFGPWFFAIWLDEKTSVPKLRNTLLELE